MDTGAFATLIAAQVGFGGVLGFLLGYGIKKIAAIILKITALITAAFTLVLAWLASVGIISVNFPAFTSTMSDSFNAVLTALGASLIALGQVLPLGGSFGLGFYLGAKKG